MEQEHPKPAWLSSRVRNGLWLVVLSAVVAWWLVARQDLGIDPLEPSAVAPGRFKTDDGRRYLWAKGPREGPAGEWFDITGSPLDEGGYQFGIGKDTIAAIDDPVFVRPDDPRFRAEALKAGRDDRTIRVIGFASNGQAKAYPISLLNQHELVNDVVGGKPVTVGW